MLKKFLVKKSTRPLAATMLSVALLAPVAQASPEPFIGDIMMTAGMYCPRGFAEASGQLLPVQNNTALFSILGTQYGGDGRTTFALPDLRGRAFMDNGSGPGLTPRNSIGQKFGEQQLQISANQIGAHTHAASTTSTLRASSGAGQSNEPENLVLANDGSDKIYTSDVPNTTMNTEAVTSITSIDATGGDTLTLDARQPYVTIRFCIALQGTFPSRN